MATCKTAMETNYVSVQPCVLVQLSVLHSLAVRRIVLMDSGSTKWAVKFAGAKSVAR